MKCYSNQPYGNSTRRNFHFQKTFRLSTVAFLIGIVQWNSKAWFYKALVWTHNCFVLWVLRYVTSLQLSIYFTNLKELTLKCVFIERFFQNIIKEIRYLTETLCSYKYLIRESSSSFLFLSGEAAKEQVSWSQTIHYIKNTQDTQIKANFILFQSFLHYSLLCES